MIKIRAKMSELESRQAIENINKDESWFLKETLQNDKPIARLIKSVGREIDGIRNRDRTMNYSVRKERVYISADPTIKYH